MIKDIQAIGGYVLSKGANGTYADAERYDRLENQWFARRPDLALVVASVVERFCPSGGDIFEVAAGTGILSLVLAEKGYQVTAGDIQPHSLARLEHKAEEQGLLERISIQHIDMNDEFEGVPDASYDLVVQLRASRYIVGDRFYTESLRILRPGGSLVLPVFTTDNYVWKRNARREKHPEQHTTAEGIAEDLGKAGFDTVTGYMYRGKDVLRKNDLHVPFYYVPSQFLVAQK